MMDHQLQKNHTQEVSVCLQNTELIVMNLQTMGMNLTQYATNATGETLNSTVKLITSSGLTVIHAANGTIPSVYVEKME